MMLIDPVTLEPIDELTMPGRDLTKPANPLTDICGGTYFFLNPRRPRLRHHHGELDLGGPRERHRPREGAVLGARAAHPAG